VEAKAGQVGSGKARSALAFLADGSMSEMESRLEIVNATNGVAY
jgi:hypothetical protein